VRIIAGELAGYRGPGSTQTPITYLHATIAPGSRLQLDWPRDFNALVYALAGNGFAGSEQRPVDEGQLALFGDGDAITVRAADKQPAASPRGWEILVLGGVPIREQVARYGPFVMNTREEIMQAIKDFNEGRMGVVPVARVPHRTSEDASV
jgi:redox-sensitive bicupin YhaK (pirin superfamily)